MYLPKGKYCVYPQMVYRLAIVMPPPPSILDDENHFRSHFSPFQINTQFFVTKWLLAAILDERKSLSIAFIAISDQYATFFFTKWLLAAILDDISDQYAIIICFTKWLPAAILDDRKLLIAVTEGCTQYSDIAIFRHTHKPNIPTHL